MAGVVGAVSLVSSVTFHVLEMPIIEAIVEIIGSACTGFTLYNLLKPNTKLEKVENVEQLIVSFEPKVILRNT
ncbi:hypothetical protein WBP_1015 [Wolbachia endosymbiont of Brugia pahangi]|nr:hypothetical protein WBP_1015 [Wolbachia endosymbiont of Brugia pahangi]